MQPEAQAALRQVWLKREKARYQQATIANPQQAAAWRKLSQICLELGDPAAALLALDEVLALQPDDPHILVDRLRILMILQDHAAIIATADRLLARMPDSVEVGLCRMEALHQLNRPKEALAECEHWLGRSDLTVVQRMRALAFQVVLLTVLERFEEALAAAEEGLMLTPGEPVFQLNRAELLLRLHRYEPALANLDRLLNLPDLRFKALCIKIQSLVGLQRFDAADHLLREAFAEYPWEQLANVFDPRRVQRAVPVDGLHKRFTARGLHLLWFFQRQAECDWSDRDAVLADIDDLLQDALRYRYVAGMEPHRLLSLPIDPALQRAVAQAQAQAIAAHVAPLRAALTSTIRWPDRRPGERLRVGYVSGDFRNHATAHLARKLFQVHDHSRFEIIGYSLWPGDDSRYWHDIVNGCDRFVELAGLSNAEAAARIAQDQVHILVDLHGYTGLARPELFALKLAPIQVSFLGYPGTLGADYIPYLIADQTVLPDWLRAGFTEQPVYLPDSYQVNDDEQPVAATGLTRVEAGLPERAFVYCCFNGPYKIEPTVFAVWMRILRQVPKSVLWLLTDSSRGEANLRMAASQQGVDSERLIFAPRLPKPDHLERLGLADLFLDTWVLGAHTTASDALWVGLPVLTRAGGTFQSRVCASLLTALGLTDLIVENDQNYEALAVAAAHQPAHLQAWRERLIAQRLIRPPFATSGFARQIEQAFDALWALHQAGDPPKALYIQSHGHD